MRILILCLLLAGCAIDPGRGISTGLDGCVSLQTSDGQILITGLGTLTGKDLTYTRVNEQRPGGLAQP